MNLLKKLFLFFCFFCFIYKPEFIFIPHSINLFMGSMGILLSLRNNVKKYISLHTQANLRSIIRLITPFVVISIISIIVNFSSDTRFIRYGISVILAYYGAYWLAYMFYKFYGTLNAKILIYYLLYATLLHQLIALIMFFDYSIYSLLQSLVRSNESAMDAMDRTLGFRLQGLGASFFTAGMIYGYVLIMLSLGVRQGLFNTRIQPWILFFYVFITIVGLMSARVIFVGAGLGLLIMLSYYITSWRKLIKTIGGFIMILMAIGFIVIKINPDLMLEFEELFDFAFELVNNYQDTGELQSGTTDKLLSMWETLPDTLKTWLIGDARWTAADGRHYYMEVDVGYLRNLWYFGIIGTVIYLIYNLKTLKLILNRKCVFDAKVGKYAWIFLFIYTLILNTKGPIDLVFYIIPFLFIDRYSNNCRLD